MTTWGANGPLLAPTIVLDKGQSVTLNVINDLPDLTTMHWHGMHVSAANDGGPHSLILPGTTWSPSFTVLDKASTYWYHPHGHGLTDFQVSMGIAGMIIVRDAEEAALALPRTYGIDDVPLILQAKAIVGGQIALHTGLDSIVIVNGVRNAVASVPGQVVRLRCLNGASERTFLLGFSNGLPFHVIGTDGGLLTAPVTLSRLQMMPGERAELLVDLGGLEGSTFQMMAYNSELPNGIIGSAQVGTGMAYLDGYQENALNGADFPLLSFVVTAPTPGAITAIPPTLVSVNPYLEADADLSRTFTFEPETMGPLEMIEGPFEMNGVLFDMGVINETVELNATEIWEFVNNTMVGHPIHIHDIQFNILDRNGLPPQPWELGWKDVVYVPPMGSTRVITRFTDFADPVMPYMYHCHLLMHEDEGMMGQFVVVDPNSIAEEGGNELWLWPNPVINGQFNIHWPGAAGEIRATLSDASGRTVYAITFLMGSGERTISLPGISPGIYTLHLAEGDRLPVRKQLFIPYN